MDREQEKIQFLGFFGIFKGSFKIIFSWPKIFTQITLALILPLSFIFLAQINISDLLVANIIHKQQILHRYHRSSHSSLSEWAPILLFKATYYIFFLILSLLSTAAVVYTVACIYTAKHVAFKKVMSVIPKVWKRLMVTFLWNFIIFSCYNIVVLIVLYAWAFLLGSKTSVGNVALFVLLILYLMGFVYIGIIWQLASVISVLEDCYGMEAMIKSKSLIKGKTGVACAIFIVLSLFLLGLQLAFMEFDGRPFGLGVRIGSGVLCLLILIKLVLLSLVVQTVFYLVCKSHHHESIDKSTLSDHLEDYLYVLLNPKNVQVDQSYV